MAEVRHAFGGAWTRTKLERVSAYLPYFTEEFGEGFGTMCVDGFAGTGRVDRTESKHPTRTGFFKFPESPPLLGSAQRALLVTPPFDRYVFIDENPEHCESLRELRASFPDLEDRVKVRCGDANEKLLSLCKKTDWSRTRAVFFLDPYGMEADWYTIERIAATGAADLWYLFPLSTVLRMLPRKKSPPDKNRPKLDRFFGEEEWFDTFYRSREETHGIPKKTTTRTWRDADGKAVIDYFRGRLESMFSWVAKRPLRIVTHGGNELFTLFFASSIPAPRPAHEVVNDILSIPSAAHNFPGRFEQLRGKLDSRR